MAQASRATAAGEEGDEELESFARPLLVEGSPLSSYLVSALPETAAWAQVSALHDRTTKGRAVYERISGRLSCGLEWSPHRVPRFSAGGRIAPLQLNLLHTEVPPAIDEWGRFVDLGEMDIYAKYNLFKWKFTKTKLLLTPYVRFHLPTDTSRTRNARRMPMKLLLGSDVGRSPWFLVEPGAAFAAAAGPATFYASTGMPMGSVAGEVFLFLWNVSFGAAIEVPLVYLVLETGGFVVHSKGNDLWAWHASPGVRFERGKLRVEAVGRFALPGTSRVPFGKFTAGLAVHRSF